MINTGSSTQFDVPNDHFNFVLNKKREQLRYEDRPHHERDKTRAEILKRFKGNVINLSTFSKDNRGSILNKTLGPEAFENGNLSDMLVSTFAST